MMIKIRHRNPETGKWPFRNCSSSHTEGCTVTLSVKVGVAELLPAECCGDAE